MIMLLSILAALLCGYLVGAVLNYPRGFEDGVWWQLRHHKNPVIPRDAPATPVQALPSSVSKSSV